MPIKIPANLPAAKVLNNENIFVMSEHRAYHQDIRPLNIAILNLMPTKITTETQILRLLGNSPLQVDTVLLHPKNHNSKNTPGPMEFKVAAFVLYKVARTRNKHEMYTPLMPVAFLPLA